MTLFSVIVPVYNRPDEIDELLYSLKCQTDKLFEVVVMEGECERSCRKVCEEYGNELEIQFHTRSTGRSERRNEGMRLAKGDYFILLDSDVTVPKDYIEKVRKALTDNYVDCYGGPDTMNDSFTPLQKAVNFAMTSLLTTGGIRGRMKDTSKYLPRAFNMGFSREVFEKTGGYLDIIGEDTDLSLRIREAGFSVRLIPESFVYHKRRIDLKGLFRQVKTFGKARVLLAKRHKGSLKLTHLFPSCFVVGHIVLLLLALLCSWMFLLPILIYMVALFMDALWQSKNLKISILSIVASYTQLTAYGIGFMDELLTHKAEKQAAESLYRQ